MCDGIGWGSVRGWGLGCVSGLRLGAKSESRSEAGFVMAMKVTERDQFSSVTHPSLRVPFALRPNATESNTGLTHRFSSFISEHCFRN